MKFKKLAKFVILIILGSLTSFLLNYLLIEKLIIPDPCYYHSHETTKFFNLFYELTALEGYHPTPTRFNLIITLIAGAMTGLFVGLKFTSKKQKGKNNSTQHAV